MHAKLVDTRMIEDLFGGTIARALERVKTGVTKARQQLNDPTIYYYFEYLHNEMKKREQQPLNTLLSVFLSRLTR